VTISLSRSLSVQPGLITSKMCGEIAIRVAAARYA